MCSTFDHARDERSLLPQMRVPETYRCVIEFDINRVRRGGKQIGSHSQSHIETCSTAQRSVPIKDIGRHSSRADIVASISLQAPQHDQSVTVSEPMLATHTSQMLGLAPGSGSQRIGTSSCHPTQARVLHQARAKGFESCHSGVAPAGAGRAHAPSCRPAVQQMLNPHAPCVISRRDSSSFFHIQAFAQPLRQRRRCVSAGVAAADRHQTGKAASHDAHDNFLAWLSVRRPAACFGAC